MRELCAAWAEDKKHWQYKRAAKDLGMLVGDIPLKDLGVHQANMLVGHWRSQMARNTVCGLRHTLHGLLDWLVTQGGHPELTKHLASVPGFDPRQEIYTKEEKDKLLLGAAPWLRCWILAGLDLGLRSREIMRLAPCHYDSERKEIRGLPIKNDRRVTKPVSTDLQEIFNSTPLPPEYSNCQDCEIPFIDLLKEKTPQCPSGHVTYQNFRAHFSRLKKRTGVRKILRTHDLRRTTATEGVVEHGWTIFDAQKFLNHKSIATTALYIAHTDQERLRPVLEGLSHRGVISFAKRAAAKKRKAASQTLKEDNSDGHT